MLHSSGDDPSDCFVSHLAHTFIYRIRQTVCHHYRCLYPVDRGGKVVKSIFPDMSVGLQCRSDASWMPGRPSTVLAPGSSSRAPTFHPCRVRPSLPACVPCSTPKYTHQTWHRDPPLKTACTVRAFLVCPSVNHGLTFRRILAVLPALAVFLRCAPVELSFWDMLLPPAPYPASLTENSTSHHNQELVC